MFTHLFKLIWNKKKQNFLLMLEIFIAFLGLCAGFTLFFYLYNNHKLPLGFEPENVWVVNIDPAEEIKNTDSLQLFRESMKKVLYSLKGVDDVSYSSLNLPLSGNGYSTEVKSEGSELWAQFFTTEDNYAELMGMKLLEGRWFSENDRVANDKPVVVNETLKKKLFGEGAALGKFVEGEAFKGRLKIVGVVADAKDESEAEMPGPGLYRQMDTSDLRLPYSIVVKVKPDADAGMEGVMHKQLSNTVRNAEIGIERYADIRATSGKKMLVPKIIICVVAAFLLINVGLGIFGVLWHNINKRKGEIGLRRAVGATGRSISGQLLSEALLLATLSLILGLFFALQLPLLNGSGLPPNVMYTAILYAVLTVYVLVIVCALYPSKQAAGIYPAEALHED